MRRPAFNLRLRDALRPSDLQLTLAWAGLIGLCAALVSVLFRNSAQWAQAWMWGTAGDIVLVEEQIPNWRRLIVPALGGLCAGLVIRLGAKFARGEPSTDFMEAVSVGDGTIRVRPSLIKSTASLLSVASGGSIGREGAMAQLSSMLASWIARRRALPTPRRQLLVACGAAAGIASAYNAPLGGALFVSEIVLGSIAMETLGPLVCASVVSTVTTRQLLGPQPIFEIPSFELISAFELGPYAMLGAALGMLAPLFVALLRVAEQSFVRVLPTIPARLFVGGVIVGVLSMMRPEVWGNGFASISAILSAQWMWPMVLLVLICKVAATAATVGSGAVGGVFTPTLFVGAALGGLFGGVVHGALPGWTAEPSAYALVGMGAFLAGTTHAPLTAILVLFEMTLDYGIVLPLMLACVVAYFTSRASDMPSIYTAVLARKEREEPTPAPELGTIRELVRPSPLTVSADANFATLVQVFVDNRHNYVYVVDREQHFLGAVSLHDIKAFMGDPTLANLILASEIMDAEFAFLELDASIGHALDKLLAHDGERLPVVDGAGGRVLVGSVSKRDVLLTVGMTKRAS